MMTMGMFLMKMIMKLIMMMMMMTMMMMMIMEDDDDDDNDDGQDDNNAALIKQKQKPCHRSVAKLVYNWLECYPMLCTHTHSTSSYPTFN